MAEILRRMMRERVEKEKRWERITQQQVTMLVGAINQIIASEGHRGKIRENEITIYTKNGEAFNVSLGSLIHPDVEKSLPVKFEGREVTYDRYAEYYDFDNTPQFFTDDFEVEFLEDHSKPSNNPRRYLRVRIRDTGSVFTAELSGLNSADRKLLDERFPNGPEILR